MKFRQVLIVLVLTIAAVYTPLQSQSEAPHSQDQKLSQSDAIQISPLHIDLPPVRVVNIYSQNRQVPFARFGQCQFIFRLAQDSASGLSVVPLEYEAKINQCLDIARREQINVLILPELAIAFPENVRNRILNRARIIAAQNDMVIIAGSFYDEQRFSRIAVISSRGLEMGYKLRPSRYEASPRFGFGMRPGKSLLVLHTPYGRLAVITCVDLISDSVQYTLRNLATRGEIDVIININYNPAAWEFLVEANSIARRHPIFVSITNVAGPGLPDQLADEVKKKCFPNGQLRDNGSCFGNSALFGSVRKRDEDCPNCFKAIEDLVGDQFKVSPKGPRSIPFDTMIAHIPPFEEALLVYELNLRMKREPADTNAPDEGYPTIRNLRKIPLK